MSAAFLGVDIGTSSSKGVLVDEHGSILGTETAAHEVSRPRPGWAEMDAGQWWDDFVSITRRLLAGSGHKVSAVGLSGMGPCTLLTDGADRPLRPAILYGIDTRAGAQIDELNKKYGPGSILSRGGSQLSSQAVGPKIRWVADNEPAVFREARRLYMPSSWLGCQLTGRYALDHHSASQCTPIYDRAALSWYLPWAADIAPDLELPPLHWPADILGTVTWQAAQQTGIAAGTPVITGTIDAWSEAISAGAHGTGDLMLMYGTTMFLVNTVSEPLTDPALWGTVGARPSTYNLAGGMATSGAVTDWLKHLFAAPDWAGLFDAARQSPPGANGLLLLPYFAGERTPLHDPDARGVLAGLTLSHTRGDVFRAALEATAYGVRHNVEAIAQAGGHVERVVAVGGGTQDPLWAQIVSDVTGLAQHVPAYTVGASYGAARMAAESAGLDGTEAWNPVSHVVAPRAYPVYDEGFELYRQLYERTASVAHALARLQHARHPGQQ